METTAFMTRRDDCKLRQHLGFERRRSIMMLWTHPDLKGKQLDYELWNCCVFTASTRCSESVTASMSWHCFPRKRHCPSPASPLIGLRFLDRLSWRCPPCDKLSARVVSSSRCSSVSDTAHFKLGPPGSHSSYLIPSLLASPNNSLISIGSRFILQASSLHRFTFCIRVFELCWPLSDISNSSNWLFCVFSSIHCRWVVLNRPFSPHTPLFHFNHSYTLRLFSSDDCSAFWSLVRVMFHPTSFHVFLFLFSFTFIWFVTCWSISEIIDLLFIPCSPFKSYTVVGFAEISTVISPRKDISIVLTTRVLSVSKFLGRTTTQTPSWKRWSSRCIATNFPETQRWPTVKWWRMTWK